MAFPSAGNKFFKNNFINDSYENFLPQSPKSNDNKSKKKYTIYKNGIV